MTGFHVAIPILLLFPLNALTIFCNFVNENQVNKLGTTDS